MSLLCGGCCHRRRKSLVRQLWGQRILAEPDETWCRRRTFSKLLHLLSEPQIENLVANDRQDCLLVPVDLVQTDQELTEPLIVLAKLLRWPEVASGGQLRAVPTLCRNPGSCCNPYHYCNQHSQQLSAAEEDPPPPYQVVQSGTTKVF